MRTIPEGNIKLKERNIWLRVKACNRMESPRWLQRLRNNVRRFDNEIKNKNTIRDGGNGAL